MAEQELRKRLMVAIIGASLSGKTVLARWLTRKEPDRLVIDPSSTWGNEGVWSPRPWDVVAGELRNGYQGPVIFDDGDRYVPPQGAWQTWGTIWGSHRHLGIDVFMITRLPDSVPKGMWASMDRVFIFQMPRGQKGELLVNCDLFEEKGLCRLDQIPREPLVAIDCDMWTGQRKRISVAGLRADFGNPAGR